ncbi:MAG: YraN family protein [Aggregatilineales bacterium]
MTRPKNQQTGTLGEDHARRYLEHIGYQIVTTNWHCQFGEIDIIARDGDAWTFVEVKTRRTKSTESAYASITPAKREKLVKSVHTYLNDHELDDVQWRIDVIAIALNTGKQPIIEHVKDALDW